MTTCRDIITRALQMSRIVALGRDPKASESTLGMETLQTIYDQFVQVGKFGALTDVYKTDDYEAKEYERVIAPSAITVTLPDTLDDEDNGGTRAPVERAMIVKLLNGTQTAYVYTQGDWVSLTGLALTDDAPLAYYGAMGLSALLATKISETFGTAVTTSTARLAAQFMTAVSSPRPRTVEYY